MIGPFPVLSFVIELDASNLLAGDSSLFLFNFILDLIIPFPSYLIFVGAFLMDGLSTDTLSIESPRESFLFLLMLSFNFWGGLCVVFPYSEFEFRSISLDMLAATYDME